MKQTPHQHGSKGSLHGMSRSTTTPFALPDEAHEFVARARARTVTPPLPPMDSVPAHLRHPTSSCQAPNPRRNLTRLRRTPTIAEQIPSVRAAEAPSCGRRCTARRAWHAPELLLQCSSAFLGFPAILPPISPSPMCASAANLPSAVLSCP